MEDLREKKKKKIKYNIKILIFLKKRKWLLLTILLIAIFLIFPVQIGTFIGQWVNDFIGSIIKNINI